MYVINPKQAAATKAIDTQFPMFNAPITCFSLASLLFIFTSIVPITEIIIPAPAIAIGNNTGPMPPNPLSMIFPPIS
ncbi:MAG: Uncharacterised protein [Flavobacteriaceae bacterium]|nr:MAG: Uncharacterised protein [Flavobacteriaceae bacterium]